MVQEKGSIKLVTLFIKFSFDTLPLIITQNSHNSQPKKSHTTFAHTKMRKGKKTMISEVVVRGHPSDKP